ncbi:hypothetical protein [Chlorobium limicola]|uniref:hypothetical protein n=1 Tax=Chlorobium limicola TaxID=1092 RepID=UPI00167FCABA|nr:hypothetical protein [Chlorobium limicola]
MPDFQEIQRRHEVFSTNLLKACQTGFEVFDDLSGEQIGVGEVAEIGEAIVSGDNLIVSVFAPVAFRVFLRPGLLAFMSVSWVVPLYELLPVSGLQRTRLRMTSWGGFLDMLFISVPYSVFPPICFLSPAIHPSSFCLSRCFYSPLT